MVREPGETGRNACGTRLRDLLLLATVIAILGLRWGAEVLPRQPRIESPDDRDSGDVISEN